MPSESLGEQQVFSANNKPDLPQDAHIQDAGRKRAAPHIKTFVRYGKESIDWALVTSANLSKQAWGEAPNKKSNDEVRICSYEIGVLVWPGLFAEDAIMKPTFKTDTPIVGDDEENRTVVGFRMPYSLPLQRFGQEKPWVPTMSYDVPDWKGQLWEGFGK
jgi:tyrosyl-DNA phosphodiesterase 1